MPGTLAAAAACAAWLMGSSPALPDRLYLAKPGRALCLYATGALPSDGPDCRGVFRVHPDGSTTIVAIDDFGVLVHESCHAVQHAEGRPIGEPECDAVQARAAECFRGMGAPGISP